MSNYDIYIEEILSRFKEIDQSAHRDVILFYEQNQHAIQQLKLEAYLEIKMCYGNALFEIGRYQEFIPFSQDLLEEVIYHNIEVLGGEDIFEKILFKKAAAHYQILKYQEAEKILWQLIRMNPDNAVAIYLLKRCRIKDQPRALRWIRGASIALFLITALLVAVELLLVRPFLPEYSDVLEISGIVTFLLGIMILLVADGWHRIKSFRDINQAIDRLRSRKT